MVRFAGWLHSTRQFRRCRLQVEPWHHSGELFAFARSDVSMGHAGGGQTSISTMVQPDPALHFRSLKPATSAA